MRNQSFARSIAASVALLGTLLSASAAMAAKPVLDNGSQLAQDKPYESAQTIPDIYESRGVYGKLEGATPIDIYKFTPSKDGEQTISMMVPAKQKREDAQPLIIFVDPTDATEPQNLQLPLPAENYHVSVMRQIDTPRTYTEPALLQQYSVVVEQKVKLKKDTTYYLVALDANRVSDEYVIKTGEGKAWQARDFFRSFSSWFRLETNNYAKSSPFAFTIVDLGFVLFTLGLAALVGMLLTQETFAAFANRNKTAGFTLVKMQQFSRIIIWVALWLMALGGYLFFDKRGWTGIPFVLLLLFVPIVLNMVYQTFSLSPQVAQLEVAKREAVIPAPLRKRWFISSLISLVTVGAFIVYLAMYLSR